MKKYHHVIIAEGSYEDYTPTYYVGEVQISESDFDKKAKEIGDKCVKFYLGLPERPIPEGKYGSWSGKLEISLQDKGLEKFNPITLKKISGQDIDNQWLLLMEGWIYSLGYEKLSNVYGSDDTPYINRDSLPTNYAEYK